MCACPRAIAHAWLLRSVGGTYASDPKHEELASELLAYPFEEKSPTTVWVEFVQPDSGQKQRVNRIHEPHPAR